jgi:hypothetical protein
MCSAEVYRLAEYKRQVGVAVTVGVMLAAFVGVLALTTAPTNVATQSSQSSSTSSAVAVPSSSTGLSSIETATGEEIRSLGGSGEVVGVTNSDLNLGFYLNSLVFSAGNNVSLQIDEKNPTDRAVLASVADDWGVPNLTLGPCGTLNDPFGVGILSGYYTAENVSSGRLLQLYAPGSYNCPEVLSGITGYSFEGLGNLAGIVQGEGSNPTLYQHMDVNVTSSGYWAPTFHPFSPGYYTAVGGDEWGTLIILHFLVVPAVPPSQGFPLKFTLTTNATTVVSGQSIELRADIFNTLPQMVSLNYTSSWAWPQLTSAPCTAVAGIAIVRGYYTQSNMTAGASPLQQFPSGLLVGCPAAAGEGGHYVFEPLSDNATIYGDLVAPAGAGLITDGYYAPGQTYVQGQPNGGETITPFEPGSYTVVAGDEWGQVAFAHFVVVPP